MGQWMVRMGESMLKSKPVRKHFTRVLRNTLIAQCRIRNAEVKIRTEGGLMFVSGEEDDAIVDSLKHTFGVNAVDPFTEVEPTPEDVANAALQSNPNHIHEHHLLRPDRQTPKRGLWPLGSHLC